MGITTTEAARAMDTVIVSDLHLGLPASRPGDLLSLLQQRRFDRLILLGDIFHDYRFRHLCADTWQLLLHIRKLSQKGDAEVVWILGNHDRHLAKLVAALVGVETRESFRWTHQGRSFVALHGDRFDGFVSNYVRLAAFFSSFYAFAHRCLSTCGEWPKLLDRIDVGIRRLSEEVAAGARSLAREQGVDVIVCGHTHMPGHQVFAERGPAGRFIEYFNTGSWVERPASFITVGAQGVAIGTCP